MDPDREHEATPAAPGTESVPEPAAGPPRDEPTPTPTPAAAPPEPDPEDTLSPAVRRLVRQYDLDVTGIHGTGPAGKIRVSDVIGLLGSRADAGARADTGGGAEPGLRASGADSAAAAGTSPETDASPAAPQTTVFECDLSRVLSHRKRERRNETERSITSYFIAACCDALRVVPEIAVPQEAGTQRLGVALAAPDGGVRRTLVVAAQGLDDELRLLDGQLGASYTDDLGAAQLLIHHYGPSGSLLATPTEIGAGHAASLGIGRVRREVVVKTVDGEEAPRVAARCYVTLTFRPERVDLARANLFVATLVRVLEQWPSEPTSA